MTAHNCLSLIAVFFIVIGWSYVNAEDDVTVVSTPKTTETTAKKTLASDGTPVVHKSLHKKKKHASRVAANASPPATGSSGASATATSGVPHSQKIESSNVTTISVTPTLPTTSFPATTGLSNPSSLVPTVETGLPVARYPGLTIPIKEVAPLVPATATFSDGRTSTASGVHSPLFASLPSSVIPVTSSATTMYTPSRRSTTSSDFVFTNFKKPSNRYPWKTGIITTIFWIGEGGSSVSATDNVASAWDANWRLTNRGSDNPDDRNSHSEYGTADHASTVNPFYVALPFNDLAFPDKAREWVPRSWHRPDQNGKQVSACKDRWVWIKNAQGRSCFAQWEDVGPLRYDHAEYVFGGERPIGLGDDHAGLDVSPAVAQYLGINGTNRITSWRFVDDADVPPGKWLMYDEQAVIFTALHQLKSFRSSPDLPIQRATEPIDDQQDLDSNKKKVGASKG